MKVLFCVDGYSNCDHTIELRVVNEGEFTCTEVVLSGLSIIDPPIITHISAKTYLALDLNTLTASSQGYVVKYEVQSTPAPSLGNSGLLWPSSRSTATARSCFNPFLEPA